MLVILLVTQISGWIQGGARPYLSRIAPKTRKNQPPTECKTNPRYSGLMGIGQGKSSRQPQSAWCSGWLSAELLKSFLAQVCLQLSVLTQIIAAEGIRLVQAVIATGLLIAVADYLVSQKRVRKELMMSMREVKEEFKQSER